jgi:hypothetical protein|tara:strand:- start:469 stop:993 length:525 start_codon:yes stop_codon:yes gene_type:complete
MSQVMKSLIIDNFFDNVSYVIDEINKLEFYSVKQFNNKFNENQTWPGTRTEILPRVNTKLSEYIIQQFFTKAKNFLNPQDLSVEMYAHKRDKKYLKKDWIHNDVPVADYTCLIYISKTNLKSGTKFYNIKKKVILDVAFFQNRCLMFDARYLHKAYGHHDGRTNIILSFRKTEG